MLDLGIVSIKFKNGIQTEALIVCPEKIEPHYKKITENSQYVIYGDFYNDSVDLSKAPLYAVRKSA